MAFESADKRLGEETVELGSIESSSVFSRLCERMQCWIKVPGQRSRVSLSGRGVDIERSRKCFNFL